MLRATSTTVASRQALSPTSRGPGNLHRVEAAEPVLPERAVPDLGEPLSCPRLPARQRAEGGRMRVEGDLLAPDADDLPRDVGGAIAGEEGYDGPDGLRRRRRRLGAPLAGQALGHAGVGGG